jgi:hypothetical protein
VIGCGCGHGCCCGCVGHLLVDAAAWSDLACLLLHQRLAWLQPLLLLLRLLLLLQVSQLF